MLAKLKTLPNSTRFKITIWYSALFLLLEVLLGVIIYIYFFQSSHSNLDANLKTQARAILRVVEEKHVDLDAFSPGNVYKSEDELIWDIIYDAIVFNRRNTFIQISSAKKIIFKTANLGKTILSFPAKKEKDFALFDYENEDLSNDLIRVCLLKGSRFIVVVAYPKEFIVQTLNGLRDTYIMIAPLFLIISLIGGSLLSSKSLSRIDSIIKKTEEITAQNLNEIIPGGEYTDEYGRLVNKMNEMIQRIKTSVDFMNQFSISAAHELKTPLTILRGEIELALRSTKLPEDYIKVLKSNHEETIRMIKIIDNLFFISKSDNAQIEISKREIELNSFLNSVAQSMKILGQEKNMELIFADIPNIKISFDNDLIKQALSNIIDNAFKYGEENTSVIISCETPENEIKISVSNSGENIPDEEVEKIFTRFYRAEKSRARKMGGVGLGLAVVKSIITLHGGDIKVESHDRITKVSIIIPVKNIS
jgi:heavy metal sensor kinase